MLRRLILFVLCVTASAVADETPGLRRELVHSPTRNPSDRNVSREWEIDASDAIVQARLDADRQPLQTKVHKHPRDVDVRWPTDDARRLRSICELYEPGDEIVFFLWHNPQQKTWRIFDFIPLIAEDIRNERRRASQASLPPEDQSSRRMYHLLKEFDAGLQWLAIDKSGKWIKDEAIIRDRITQRVTAGSRVPQNADRQAILDDKSQFGGFYVYEPHEPDVSGSEFPLVLVPPDPEYREGYLRIVRNAPSHQGALPAFSRIINYNDAEVIVALKGRLNDNLVNEVWYELPGRRQVGNTYKILSPDDPPLKPMPKIEGSRIYIIRQAAWEALQQMNAKVDPPELNAK